MKTRLAVAALLLGLAGVLGLAGLLGSAALGASPTAQAAGTMTTTLSVEQTFTTMPAALSPTPDASFTYRLTPSAGAPLPAGAGGSDYRFTITGTAAVTLGPITFPAAGQYDYTLACLPDGRAGYVDDPRVYTIKIDVLPGQAPLVIAYQADGDKVPALTFAQSYQSAVTAPPPPNTPHVNTGGAWAPAPPSPLPLNPHRPLRPLLALAAPRTKSKPPQISDELLHRKTW